MTAEAHPAWRLFAELCATREEMTIDDPIVGVELSDESAARAGEGAADLDALTFNDLGRLLDEGEAFDRADGDLAQRVFADLSARDGLYRAAAHGCPAIPGSGAVA